ncbi:hypothetical protein BDZ89DRAFT_151336 [Hymenopellis radicata]|nr:hypothetical protein BDZ89DRAFT_151336 [Hymenopellis radicata]
MDRGSDLPIPQEIVDHIVDFIDDTPSFRASRLACSALYLSSQRHLSNVKLCLPLSLNSATGELRSLAGRTIHKFHELLQVSPRLTSFYTSLDIYIGRPSGDERPEVKEEFETLFTILKSLHRLDRLTVSGGTHGRLYANRVPALSTMMEKFLQHAHQLTEFTLDGVDGLQITGATLSKWVSLRKLSIICSGDGVFTDPLETEKYSLSLPNLVSLVLAGSDVYQAVRSLLVQDRVDLPFNLPNLEHWGSS